MQKYQNLSQEELDKEFFIACVLGDVEGAKYLLTSPDLAIHANSTNDAAMAACFCKSFEILDYLYINHKMQTSPELLLEIMASMGEIKIVHHLLTSPAIQLDIDCNDGMALRSACYEGQLAMTQFLIESPELNVHASKNALAFIAACTNGHLEIVKYLIPFVGQTKIDVAIQMCSEKGQVEILNFLLFETDTSLTDLSWMQKIMVYMFFMKKEKKKQEISQQTRFGLIGAIKGGSMKSLRYFMEDLRLKNYALDHIEEEIIKIKDISQIHLLEYLMNDLKIDTKGYSNKIHSLMEEAEETRKPTLEAILNLLEKRDLYHKLQSETKNDNVGQKSIKI